MANTFFQFKQFIVHQDKCAMKVTTDACLFGAWVAAIITSEKLVINNCLDIGTGTGLLPLMLAQKIQSDIDSIEIDNDAFLQATQNMAASPWADRIHVFNADAKAFSFRAKYDTIFSNPPFYENQLKGNDRKKNIAHHNEGLLLSELLPIIKKNLNTEGVFFLMLPYSDTRKFDALFTSNQLAIVRKVKIEQSPGHTFFRVFIQGKLSSQLSTDTIEEAITVCDNSRNYTPEFISLLKDYYLHL